MIKKDNTMNRNDIILLLGILVLSALLCVIFSRTWVPEAGAFAVVTVKGKECGRYPLSEDGTWKIGGTVGANRLVIREGSAWMEEASCPDHYCMKQGKISKNGEQIICLPNGIVVEIIGGEESGLDAVAS